MLKVIPFLDTLVIASVTFFFVKKKIMLPDIFWMLFVDQPYKLTQEFRSWNEIDGYVTVLTDELEHFSVCYLKA